MSEIVDVVIPVLIPNEDWYKEYKKYCENENPGRIRDMNTIEPTIYGILNHLPWVRYIWLIVYDKSQLKNCSFLDNKKVKIVEHKDIIPQEFLPNFNSVIVELFMHKIVELAENILFMNDDMIYTKDIPIDYYFKNEKSVHLNKSLYLYKPVYNYQYDYIVNSTVDFIKSITGKNYLANHKHMPMPMKKSLCNFIHTKYENVLLESCRNSHIRKNKNIEMSLIAYTLEECYNLCEYSNNTSIRTQYISLVDNMKESTLTNAIKNNHIICLNDCELLIKEEEKVKQMIKNNF